MCDLCIAECPVKAIYPVEDVPAAEASFIAVNADFFKGKSREDLERVRMSS